VKEWTMTLWTVVPIIPSGRLHMRFGRLSR